ncbi:hypothetical protein QQS21_004007 [Conoideocrella luteorostrata]|uniref:Uncharacterized protein n=1 Tax=Conoideocrella luteorostrata TaxID=1105319 RepID=A0AAJ0FVW1_9HYPO|nr:hypothetical protein QQS21_004007 [Conoideocrella luteorostrata]
MADTLEPLRGLLHRVRGAVSRRRDTEGIGLRVVHDPENANIDIVAVHGLGGQGFRSWITWDSKGAKSKPWLQELLGADVPNARIMTYGYISDGVSYRYIVRNIVYGRALDLAKVLVAHRQRDKTNCRPIIFIAHSLGGWIVKRALIISSEAADPQLKDIELSTSGVAFFGTPSPGRPSSPSPLAHVIRRTTSDFADHSPSRAIKSLAAQEPHADDMEWLEHQMEAFKAITANLPMLSFYETKKTRDGYVVEQRHSMAGSDGTQVGLQASHSELIRFHGRDANYQAFFSKFREMVDTGTTSAFVESKRKAFHCAAVHRLEYLSTGFSVPYRLPNESNPIITRQSLLDQLDSLLTSDVDPLLVELGIVNIWGLAGTGKSTLARHYVELNRDDFSFVFWIRAESWETVIASYLEFANNIVEHYAKEAPRSQVENDLGFMGVEDMLKAKNVMQLDTSRIRSVVNSVRDWLLRPENVRWLQVFDNVEPSYDIFDFIPLTLSGKVILTSQDSNCCPWGSKVQVDAMEEEEAINLLEAIVGDYAVQDSTQADAASRFVQQFAYHPQNIATAAATIRTKGLSISEYETMIATTMPLTLLGSTLHQSPVTKTVLQISSMLSPSIIPVGLLSATSHLKQAPERFRAILGDMRGKYNRFIWSHEQSSNRRGEQIVCQDPDHVEDVLQYLLDQNFIQTPTTPSDTSSSSLVSSSPTSMLSSQTSASFDYFVVDAKARDHVRSMLTDDERVDHAWMACNVCVDGIRLKEAQSSTLQEVHEFGRIMGPHAKACFDDWSSVLGAISEDDDVAWHILGRVCMTQGALSQAIGCFELSLRQRSEEMDVRERIEATLSLSSLLQKSGQLERSRDILANINIDTIDQALGFRVALARASATAARGELRTAEDQYETLELKQEAALGPTDMATVGTVQQLASTLQQLGKSEEAQALYRRVYISYQNTYGQNDRMTLEALDDLANSCKESFAIDEAENLYKQSIDIRTRVLGADHPETACALQHLAVIYDLRSRYNDANEKYQRALNIIAPVLGKADRLYTVTMENMALSFRRHAHSLAHKSTTSRPTSSRTSSTNSTKLKSKIEEVVSQGANSQRLFEEAERLYFELMAIKRSAKNLYTDEDVVETGAKLAEMYENERFFEDRRGEKVASLKGMLREGRRRGTM